MEASPMRLFEKFIKEAYGSQYVIPIYQRNYTWKKNKHFERMYLSENKDPLGEQLHDFRKLQSFM